MAKKLFTKRHFTDNQISKWRGVQLIVTPDVAAEGRCCHVEKVAHVAWVEETSLFNEHRQENANGVVGKFVMGGLFGELSIGLAHN